MKGAADNKTVLSYKGFVDFEAIGDLIGLLKNKIADFDISLVTYKKVLVILIESLENIYKYYVSNGIDKVSLPQVSLPAFSIIRKQNGVIIISSSNIIKNEDMKPFADRLDRLNRLEFNDLRKLYRKTITNGHFSNQGGAGLGLIEMAKISNEKINYKFENLDKYFSRLTLIISITNGNNPDK